MIERRSSTAGQKLPGSIRVLTAHSPFIVWLCVGAISGFVSAFWYVVSRSVDSGHVQQARVEFSEMGFQFGEIAAGSERTHTFSFTNQTGIDITIGEVKTNCGCLASGWKGQVIPSGGAGQVSLTWSTKKNASPGRLRQIAVVRFEPEGIPPEKLTVNAEIVPDIALFPENLLIDPDEASQELRIERRILTPRNFSELSVDFPSGLEVVKVSTLENARIYTFRPIGSSVHLHYNSIVVRHPSDNENKDSVVRIPVAVAESRSPVDFVPRSVTLSASREASIPGPRTHVNVISKSGQKIQIESCRLSEPNANEAIGCEIIEQSPVSGASFAVWLKAIPDQRIGRLEIDIELEVENGRRLKRTLPLYLLSFNND